MHIEFIKLCKEGKLEEAKTLYLLNINGWLLSSYEINVYDIINEAFVTSCCYNHLKVAQWIYSLKGYTQQGIYSLSDFDLSIGDAFSQSCGFGQLAIAQWLYSLDGYDIHTNIDKIFELSCNNYQLDIIKWLLQIDIFDDEILDEHLPTELYEHVFNLGYMGNKNMLIAYNKFKVKILEQIKQNNIELFEINELVGIIMKYV